MGDIKTWHFQHDVEDVNCNPQPMTLLHAFVRDQLAEKRELWLPGGRIRVSTDLFGRTWTDELTILDRVYTFESGATELPVGDVQPDVVFKIPDKWDLALEVRYTHAVDKAKELKLQAAFKDAIELDVSDLPANGVTIEELEVILRQRHRWKWISWMARVWAESSFRSRILWEQHEWTPDIGFLGKALLYKPAAAAKLRQAQKRMDWAAAEYAKLKASGLRTTEQASWLGAQGLTDRIAIFCSAMGLQPESLPVPFAQRVQLGMERHPYAWQLPIFAKFGIGSVSFTSKDVEAWMKLALPDCVLERDQELSKNGFSRTRAAAHSFLLQLEEEGLVLTDKSPSKALRVFQPKFATRQAFHEFLNGVDWRPVGEA